MERLEKNFYNISEVAEMLGIAVSTLRFWEKRFTLIKPRRTPTGRRMYTPSDVEKIQMISFLLNDRGMRIEAAEEQLRSNPKGVERQAMAVSRLRVIRSELQAIIDAIPAR